MTLDEAIKHCEDKSAGCSECADEHRQLAEWLKELKSLRQLNVNSVNSANQKCVIFRYFVALKSELTREFYEDDGFIFCLIWAILVPVLVLTLWSWLQ